MLIPFSTVSVSCR